MSKRDVPGIRAKGSCLASVQEPSLPPCSSSALLPFLVVSSGPTRSPRSNHHRARSGGVAPKWRRGARQPPAAGCGPHGPALDGGAAWRSTNRNAQLATAWGLWQATRAHKSCVPQLKSKAKRAAGCTCRALLPLAPLSLQGGGRGAALSAGNITRSASTQVVPRKRRQTTAPPRHGRRTAAAQAGPGQLSRCGGAVARPPEPVNKMGASAAQGAS